MAYEGAAQRMLAAIGEPEMVDTRNDPRQSRLFANKVIRRYPAFAEFYGMEDSIQQVVSFFHAVELGEGRIAPDDRSEEHTSELQSHLNIVFRPLLEKKT